MNIPNSELQEEEAHLATVIRHIDSDIAEIELRRPNTAAYQSAANKLQTLDDERLRHLTDARPSPYVGRIDICKESSDQREMHYFGSHNIEDIRSWQSPIAALFYDPASGSYRGPKGQPITATVQLKRIFEIEDSVLESVTDALRLLEPCPSAAIATTLEPQQGQWSNAALDRSLAATGQSSLSQVIATIQPDQYQRIAAAEQKVMLVQGAAGSGKSLIGLHRLAYLLSPANELPTRPSSDRVIMFGPSKAFLSYVRNLLPSLGFHGIQQTTLQEWMLRGFTRRPRIERANSLLRQLMSNRSSFSDQDYSAERRKGSLGMRDAIDRYLKGLRREVERRIDSDLRLLTLESPNGRMQVDNQGLKRSIPSADLPFNVARDTFINSIVRNLWNETDLVSIPGSLAPFRQQVLPQVASRINAVWPFLNYDEQYMRMLASDKNLISMGVTATQPFKNTDLAPLLYLDHQLNGHDPLLFEHIVVDEAQDVSPLEIYLLKLHSRNGWFTILGDVQQRLTPYRGIEHWREFHAVFAEADVERVEARNSYRSTVQITRFGNRILRRLPRLAHPPIPYSRSGDYPRLHRSRSAGEMYRAIVTRAQRANAEGLTVAVLKRTSQDATSVMKHIPHASLLTVDGEIGSDFIVSPILLSKGLEFDLVVVAGVDADSFTGSEMDNRLLYLACTRARHSLELHWFGRPSPLIIDLGASGTDLGGQLDRARGKRSAFDRFSRGS